MGTPLEEETVNTAHEKVTWSVTTIGRKFSSSSYVDASLIIKINIKLSFAR